MSILPDKDNFVEDNQVYPAPKTEASTLQPLMDGFSNALNDGWDNTSIKALFHVFADCLGEACAQGLKRNQALLSADRLTRKLTGRSPLAWSGFNGLLTPVNEHLLTTTQVGSLLPQKLSAQKVNQLLSDHDYQYRLGKAWLPTDKGIPFCELLDTGRKHHSGTPIQQLKWHATLIEELAKVM